MIQLNAVQFDTEILINKGQEPKIGDCMRKLWKRYCRLSTCYEGRIDGICLEKMTDNKVKIATV